jgi:hypothetical protein
MIDMGYEVEYKGVKYRVHHGDAFDRGSADSYYGRGRQPHRGGVGGESGPRVDELSEQEVKDYHLGYDYNEEMGDKKDWR